jgi:hypothetical protein
LTSIKGADVDMPLYGNVKVRHVVQDKVDELLIALFADEFDERLGLEWFAQPIRR